MRFAYPILCLVLALSGCAVNPVPTPAKSVAKASADVGTIDPDADSTTSDDASLSDRDVTASKFACTGNEPPDAWTGKFGCGSCGSDVFYPLECVGGTLACVKSYPAFGTGPAIIDVPPEAEVLDMDDFYQHTGPCAFMAQYFVPGFRLWSPASLETNRDPKLPLTLEATLGAAMMVPTFDTLFADPAAGDAAIHALVTLTDMQTGKPVDYAVGLPQSSTKTCVQTVDLTPAPLAAAGWYRVTVKPGDTQSFVKLVTFDAHGALKAPKLTDFYTGSRPMLASEYLAYKPYDKFSGYILFQFTEDLVAADLPSQVTVLVDGVPVSGCTSYLQPCPGDPTNPTSLPYLQLKLITMPVGFKTLELRLPAAARSVKGGTLGDGAKDNPYASVVGAEVVYVLHASDMTVEDGGVNLRWRFAPK